MPGESSGNLGFVHRYRILAMAVGAGARVGAGSLNRFLAQFLGMNRMPGESSGNLGFVHRYRILAMAACVVARSMEHFRRVWGQGR